MFILKKIFFYKTHIMDVENFNRGAKYEKTINFNLEQFSLFKTTKHF